VFWISLRREHRRWTQQTEQAQQWVAVEPSRLSETAPHVSGWSPAQHLHHVADINHQILEQLTGDDMTDSADGADKGLNLAGYVLITLGRLPRGRAQAPTAFRPPDTVDLDALANRIGGNRQRLGTLADRLGALRQAVRRFPHPVLGHLDASEWLRFARIHTGHHHRIIRDIVDEIPDA
jgi:hypothetical protein